MGVPTDPLARFRELLARAEAAQNADCTAVALATADLLGRPSVRMVLLKGVDAGGFVFYTNYESRKARELRNNPHAALCFHWPAICVQVRIEGDVEQVSEEESDAYFATRPRGHQLAAWASFQSAALVSREALEQRYGEAEERFLRRPVPRPPSWGGYRLLPERIELWFGHENRLHDRLLFTRQGESWSEERLFP